MGMIISILHGINFKLRCGKIRLESRCSKSLKPVGVSAPNVALKFSKAIIRIPMS